MLTGLKDAVPVLTGHLEIHDFSRWMAAISTAAAVVGLAVAGIVYLRRREGDEREPLEAAKPVYTLLSEKYYVDALYEDAVVRRAFYRRFAGTVDWIDRNLVDGTVDSLGWIFRNIGSAIGRLQTGEVQAYGAAILLGSLVIILVFLLS